MNTLALLLLVCVGAFAADEWPPKFCNNLGCPKFTVVEKHSEYELREYEVSNWVSSGEEAVDHEDVSGTLFRRLFAYIQGANDKNQVIDMTAPVLSGIFPGPGPTCKNNFTRSFFLDPKVTNPPKPTDETVFLNQQPHQRVYVRSFPGYIVKFSDWVAQAVQLAQAIGDSSKYHTDHYYFAGYNNPYQLTNRHNEVWYIAK